MTWAADAQLSGYTFRTSFRHRKKLMIALYDRLDIHGLKPKKKTYRTHDGTNDEVIIFDFRQSLLSLLRDTSLMTDDNMLFTGTSPYDSIDENNDDYSDINSSERYAQIQSYKPLRPDEVRIPLILYVDKANIDEKGTINFEPLMYTLGWWNNATRKLPEAWRCLGLINDLDKKSKESKKAKPADKACNYQSAVGAIVESLVYVQKEDGILYDLKYKNNIYRCRLTFVVQFLSGDIKASDAMCGRFSAHTLGMARSNHDCDCKPTKNDDYSKNCSFVTRVEIESLFKDVHQQHLLKTEYSQHTLDIAMYKLNFGGCIHHIHGNAPMDFLHSLNLGLYNYLLQVLYGRESLSDYCSEGDRYRLDQLSIEIGAVCKHQSDRTFARTNFVFGITAMSKIKGQEKSGVLIILLISMIIDKGKSFWSNTTRKRVDIKSWILLLESTLCFEQWVYLPSFKKNQMDLYQTRIRNYMKLCKKVISRHTGNGLNLPKFHGLLHHIWNIKRHGAPMNFDTTSLESNLKENGKYPAATTVKGADVFQYQLASRMTDSIVINTIIRQKFPESFHNFSSESNTNSSDEDIISNTVNNHCATRFTMKVSNKVISFSQSEIQENTCNDKLLDFCSVFPDGDYKCITEIKKDTDIFRGHYCYKGKLAWNDYALFNWTGISHSVPGRIEFFVNVDDNHIRILLNLECLGVYALIHSCVDDTLEYVEGSKIVQKSYLEFNDDGNKVYRLIHIDSINSTCFAIPNIGKDSDHEIFFLQPPSTWGEIFINRTYTC